MSESLPRWFGRYQLIDAIGAGANGAAYLARPSSKDADLPPLLVVKCLHAARHDDEIFVRRFKHEAALAVCIDSPHVVKVYDAGCADDILYIALEHIAGATLFDVLQPVIDARRELPLPAIAEIMSQFLSGLELLHTARTESGEKLEAVHRDLSPKNVMIGDDGIVRIIDLGLGRSVIRDWETKAGSVMGTPGYIAPEQISGGIVDHRADIYAAGVLFFELLTSSRMIEPAPPLKMLARTLTRSFVPPSQLRAGVSPMIDRVVERALESDPAVRFLSAKDLADAIAVAIPRRSGASVVAAELMRTVGEKRRIERARVATLLEEPVLDETSLRVESATIYVRRTTQVVARPRRRFRRVVPALVFLALGIGFFVGVAMIETPPLLPAPVEPEAPPPPPAARARAIEVAPAEKMRPVTIPIRKDRAQSTLEPSKPAQPAALDLARRIERLDVQAAELRSEMSELDPRAKQIARIRSRLTLLVHMGDEEAADRRLAELERELLSVAGAPNDTGRR